MAARAIHKLASWNMRQETLPQGRDAGTGFRPVALFQAGQQQGWPGDISIRMASTKAR